ncbi:MAG: SdpI family protein [Clostridia bacterium]|nr:SdpI family protein [Clostridia bacterium]
MFKPHKKKLLFSSLLILLPILIGLLMWNDLPAAMTTHWGADGTPDGQSGKVFSVFGLPLILLAAHWFCLWFTLRDPKNQNQTTKAIGMFFWIMPVVSLFSTGLVYTTALTGSFNFVSYTPALLGLMFVVIGNYLPKCRQNRTLGIKLPWTFHTEENWNRTHRFGGMVWVIGGLLMIFAVFLPPVIGITVSMLAILALCLIPILYSYLLYRRQVKNHEIPAIAPSQLRSSKWAGIVLIVILLLVALLMFTGDIEVTLGADALTIDATYWHSLEVEYAAIDSIEYRTDLAAGLRTNGFGSARLHMGLFTNAELGNYTRYAYVGSDASILITCGDDHLVIALQEIAETEALYQQILEKVE